MPHANTNIFKRYPSEYEEIINFYNSIYVIKDIKEYMLNCNDIVCLDSYYDTINQEINKINKFILELEGTLDAIRLIKEECKYREMISSVIKIKDTYNYQIEYISPYIESWRNGY